MFHTGDLQSGISRAIQEQKVVACFVCDDSSESATWEREWLQNGWVSSLLEQKAVLLRIQAGSNEQGFLAAFCPMEITPTLVLIENGQLQEQLVSGITRDDFINSVRKALGANPIPGVSPSPKPQTQGEAAPSTITQTQTPTPRVDRAPTATITPAPPSSAPEEHIPVSPILPPSSKAKGKQKVPPPETKTSSTPTAAAQAARDALRKKKQEEKEELARIQARIEADKAERKAQAEARKAERERQTSPSTGTNASSAAAQSSGGIRRSQAKEVHLNVRLFDGHTIRSTFPRTATLQSDVRPWIDAEFAARAEHPHQKHPPYYFKQILAPLPSRELSAGEESESLGDIDLAPSATLVLVPIKGYTEAYSGGGGGVVGGVLGWVTGLVWGVFGLAASALGYVGSALGSVVGSAGSAEAATTQSAEQQEGSRGEGRRASPNSSGMRVRTLADQREGEPMSRQLYNGNQLNFEPNDDQSNDRR
ncbi:uncharacterized protein EI97DRAFT_433871 [Westerdykella ornata]|uniref:UBX domain-containing protein 2 n=1 Tax=Westerdykella ornata TaxID=318751 RepID=A0A6A6JHR9_WESOR|nr:uncharacterized protein EI97DRAFT_433871 [Westerdykella ornata]KAF2275937.1 hypothetical protein EI97DRAFT_433871 [Westerdykella ornata]